MEMEYQQIRKETYRISINNALFYSKLGKYPQIMDLLKLIGFRRVSNQFNSAFNYLRDPTSKNDLDREWETPMQEQSETEKLVEEISKSNVL